ncbi:MAG: AraC family ligand binding domain-containing protein [Bryobacteraceae bacterium]
MAKTVLAAFATLSTLFAAAPSTGVEISNQTIQATLKKAPANGSADRQIRVVDVGKANVGVAVVHRSAQAPPNAIEHDDVTEVYHILRGSGTLVLGGTVVNGKREAADSKVVTDIAGPSVRGAELQNGQAHRVGPGDVIIIPAGVGHSFSSVDGAIDYLVVRVDADKVLRKQ